MLQKLILAIGVANGVARSRPGVAMATPGHPLVAPLPIKFVKDFASIAEPLHNLTKKNAHFQWHTEHQAAFDALKRHLTQAPVLGYSLAHGGMILDTDASDTGIGAVLSQMQGGTERVLVYGSRKLTKAEQNYCTSCKPLSILHHVFGSTYLGGFSRTVARLQTRYYWYHMREDVALWCRTCTNCACRARPHKTPQAPMGTVRVGATMERIALDIMDPLNETEHKNKVFQEMCRLFGIDKTHTIPSRPQSNGQVERFNATLQKILTSTSEHCHWNWDLMIPYAVMAYRVTKHGATGFTPHFMMFGREIREPVDQLPDSDYATSAPEYVQQMSGWNWPITSPEKPQ
ncbi:interleukin-1 receptor accessory protein-like 1-A [Pimephales promelas]|nr:interleukin-1 receptor accessory protein-like 1-A [Pimephales promelas]